MPTARRIRQVRWARFRVFAVSGVAILIFLTLAYLMTSGTLFQPESVIYLYLPDATGMGVGSPVSVDGIDVGEVSAVNFVAGNNPNREVRLSLEIQSGRLESMTPDSYAEIGSDTMIGDHYVDITSGTMAGHLRPGAELQYKAPAGMMKSVDIAQLQKQLRAVDAVLTDIELGRTELGRFIQGDQMYGDVLRRVVQIEGAMRTAVSASTSLGQALYSDRLYRQIQQPIETLDRQLAVPESGQGTGGALLRDNAEYESLLHTVGELRGSIDGLRRSDLMRSDAMYVSWNRGVATLIQSVDRFNATPEMETTDTYDTLSGMLREVRQSIRDFQEHPRAYLRMKLF